MEKVTCLRCKDIGFTASPKYTLCHCKGNLAVISDEQFTVKLAGLFRTIKEKEVCSHTAVLSRHSFAYNHSQHENVKTEVQEYETVAHSS